MVSQIRYSSQHREKADLSRLSILKMALPKGWETTKNIGELIQLDNVSFVVFKTPIEQTRWTCSNVLASCPELKLRPSMILSISSFKDEPLKYDKEEFTELGIGHESLHVFGGKRVPSDFVVSIFFDIVEDFIENSINGMIGVHATWSVEKTSYLIARFLIEKKGWEPDEALHTADTTRGEVIAKETYKLDLLEGSGLWETEIFQHCIVVDFEDPSSARDDLINTLIFDVMAHGKLQERNIKVLEDDLDMDLTVWLNMTCLRVWIHSRGIKRQIQEVLDEEGALLHENFTIER